MPLDSFPNEEKIKSSKTPSARELARGREKVTELWIHRVRQEISTAARLDKPLLVDTVPAFIANLAESLAEEFPRKLASENTTISQEHGSERARMTAYRPDQLIREYHILRDVIFEYLDAVLTPRDREILQMSFDNSICEAMMAYFLAHSRLREQFVAGLSHELRNPLGAAKMSAELILDILRDPPGDQSQEDLRGLAQRVVNNTRRGDRLIQDLLDATVIQIGEKVPLKIRECKMLSLVRDVVVELPRKEQARVHVSGTPAHGHWDADSIRRAIENLLTNAIKYGRSDKPVTLSVTTSFERVNLRVHNHGNPIPIEEQEVLFQVFKRSQDAKQSGKVGWGIGLALVRGVAEAHGGSINVESSPELGTTFVIDIPADARPHQRSTEVIES